MDAVECMKTRRSIRAFKNQAVPREILEDIVDCGRMAATAINVQPWRFVVVQDGEMRRRLAETTDYGRFIADAPVCIAVFCQDTKYYIEDGSAATQNILNAAHAHGLGSCWVAGDKKAYADAIRDLLGVPSDHKLISLVPIGYPDQDPHPGKKTRHEVMHWERF